MSITETLTELLAEIRSELLREFEASSHIRVREMRAQRMFAKSALDTLSSRVMTPRVRRMVLLRVIDLAAREYLEMKKN